MTCSGCEAKVQLLLSNIPGVKNIQIDLDKATGTIEMGRHIPTAELKSALKDYPKYQLSDNNHQLQESLNTQGETRSWIEIYKPILFVFAYILGITLIIESINGEFLWTRWMQHFMAGFFLVFSFFKLLNLREFADTYATYDIVGKKWPAWGYIYAFIELGLGIAFLTGFNPIITNTITLIVMSISIVGVLQSVLNKRKIKCACLGDVFNLPMSTITIIEDALMIVMSGIMVATMI